MNLIKITLKTDKFNQNYIENYWISNLSFNQNLISKPEFESSSIRYSNLDLESESSLTI